MNGVLTRLTRLARACPVTPLRHIPFRLLTTSKRSITSQTISFIHNQSVTACRCCITSFLKTSPSIVRNQNSNTVDPQKQKRMNITCIGFPFTWCNFLTCYDMTCFLSMKRFPFSFPGTTSLPFHGTILYIPAW